MLHQPVQEEKARDGTAECSTSRMVIRTTRLASTTTSGARQAKNQK